MPFPPTTDTSEQITHTLIRNTLLGFVLMFGLAFGMSIFATSAQNAAAVAVVPALFAAPFVGGLTTVISYLHAPTPDTDTESPT